MVETILHGFLIGFLASMPVGAIAILSVQRTLNFGVKAGFFIVMCAAIGDFIYATIAAFGMSFISDFIVKNEFTIAFLGSLFLIFMGIKIYRSDTITIYKKKLKDFKISTTKIFKDFLYSLLLALSNPITIIGFGSFFATFGMAKELKNNFEVIILLISILLGAASWWLLVSVIVHKFRKKMTLKSIVIINKISGLLIVVLGIALLIFLLFFKRYHNIVEIIINH